MSERLQKTLAIRHEFLPFGQLTPWSSIPSGLKPFLRFSFFILFFNFRERRSRPRRFAGLYRHRGRRRRQSSASLVISQCRSAAACARFLAYLPSFWGAYTRGTLILPMPFHLYYFILFCFILLYFISLYTCFLRERETVDKGECEQRLSGRNFSRPWLNKFSRH